MIEYWEKFTGGPTKPANERVHITINHKYVLSFNRNVHKLLSDAKAVELLFNRKEGVIGVSPVHEQIAEAFPVLNKRSYYVINAAPFCRHFGIRIEGTEKFVDPYVDDSGVLRLNLAATVSVRNRKRGEPRERRSQTAR